MAAMRRPQVQPSCREPAARAPPVWQRSGPRGNWLSDIDQIVDAIVDTRRSVGGGGLMAYIRRLPSGKWQATVRGPDGRRHTKTNRLKSVVKEWGRAGGPDRPR